MINRRLIQLFLATLLGFSLGLAIGFGKGPGGSFGIFFRSRDWPLTAEAFSNVAQILALLVGGLWTYRVFVRQRLDWKRACLQHEVTILSRSQDWMVIRVRVCIQNIGSVVIVFAHGSTQIFQVSPVSEQIAKIVAGEAAQVGESLVKRTKLPWPKLVLYDYPLQDDEFILEPGETGSLYCEFSLPAKVESILVRTELPYNSSKSYDERWLEESVHTLVGRRCPSDGNLAPNTGPQPDGTAGAAPRG
jgi:hypothetical protein